METNLEEQIHYDDKYFDWQKRMGEFATEVDNFKFAGFIEEHQNVMDFGCGGGFLLKSLNCKEKLGIEINPTAAENARKMGIPVVSQIEEVPNMWADVIISNHALEHVENPLEVIKLLKEKLKDKGKMVFVVPHELKNNFDPKDQNQHLYTWSPMCLGNLFKRAGLNVLSVETIKHLWPPYFFTIKRIIGKRGFFFTAKLYSILKRNLYQVKIVAQKD